MSYPSIVGTMTVGGFRVGVFTPTFDRTLTQLKLRDPSTDFVATLARMKQVSSVGGGMYPALWGTARWGQFRWGVVSGEFDTLLNRLKKG